jgi:type IX secretion system PorP/SprF family membrane protein
MRKSNHIAAIVLSLIMIKTSYGQDPVFSQFFSSPLNVNPALTARINEDWRLISNIRDQWNNPASAYATGTVSFDAKILQKNTPNIDEKNIVGIGGMLMYDYAMDGIVKSAYASLNLSYNILVAEDFYGNKHRLGLGFGGTYADRNVDFSRLNFQQQFTGTGFDTNLPTGESALSNMTPYFSASAGILYTFIAEKSNLEIGAAVYHLNKPKQTVLKDPLQFVPERDVVHANFETFINKYLVLNTNGIYQYQAGVNYFSVGGALGFYLDQDGQSILNIGLWYWSGNAVVPYIGVAYNDFQFGLSYDATISKLSQSASRPTTFELSIIFRGKNKPFGEIPDPWH